MSGRILVVDAGESSHHATVQLLASKGYCVVSARTCVEAWAELDRSVPDLVLLKTGLPDGDGWELSRRIRERGEARRPLVILTGKAAAAPQEHGADVYLARPAGSECLLALAHAMLRIRKAENALRESQCLWRTLMESSADGLLLLDREFRIRMANRAALSIFDCPSTAIVGEPVAGMSIPETRSEIESAMRSIKPGRELVLRSKAQRPNGTTFPVEFALGVVEGSGEYAYSLAVRDLGRPTPVEIALEKERADRRERLAGEVSSIERSFGPRPGGVAAALYGLAPLEERLPGEFEQLSWRYRRAIETAIEQRSYRDARQESAAHLAHLARRLGFLQAGPRDVVEIHSRTLRAGIDGMAIAKQQVWLEEGRLALIEIMGNLMNYYRQMAFGGRTPG